MEARKTTRRLDGLGRIVIPIDIRRRMGINTGSELLIEYSSNNEIRLKNPQTCCTVCGSTDDIIKTGDTAICRTCAKQIHDAFEANKK